MFREFIKKIFCQNIRACHGHLPDVYHGVFPELNNNNNNINSNVCERQRINRLRRTREALSLRCWLASGVGRESSSVSLNLF